MSPILGLETFIDLFNEFLVLRSEDLPLRLVYKSIEGAVVFYDLILLSVFSLLTVTYFVTLIFLSVFLSFS